MTGGVTAFPGAAAAPPRAAPPAPVLDVRGLTAGVRSARGLVPIVRDVSFAIGPGEIVGLVGESGSGKSLTGLSIMGLLGPGLARTGQVLLEGQDLVPLSPRQLRRLRGDRVSMIFQEPMSALDPVFTVGAQISETLIAHRPVGRREARERAVEALAAVGIPSPARRYDDYPHQLSGGMRQRVMIAIALICEPKLLIADEPTTALDVTVQAQVVALLAGLAARTGTALLFITHDLGVVAESCSRLLTVYAGEIVEDARVEDALRRPRHPYTSGLLRSIPRLSPRKARLPSIPGRVPGVADMPEGCRFAPRCGYAEARCRAPQPLRRGPGYLARCVRHAELELPGSAA